MVRELAFQGAADAEPHPDILATLRSQNLRAVVICPSNPFISIEPILAVRGMRAALRDCSAPVLAVSPIIGGRAVKGPTAKMMAELGVAVTPAAVASRYADLLDGYVVDHADASSLGAITARSFAAPILMQSLADRERLAHIVLGAADELRR